MKTIAVINDKGGVGKTTVTANLAAYLVAAGKKKDEAIALIVNIALGDAVLAQIVGGKPAR